jgi:formamidopyrimidine-DNA glycosylase
MPELPEVEITCRGVARALIGRQITQVIVRERRLRWPIPRQFAGAAEGQTVRAVTRRAKYILLKLDQGTAIVHLGMSGSLRVLGADVPVLKHDHWDLVLDSGAALRFHDPRRFGSLHWTLRDPGEHPLLVKLAPEPLESAFDGDYLFNMTRRRRVATKLLIMNSHCVVGVGNIYASEALFRARVSPRKAAGRLTREEAYALVKAIKDVLAQAIETGGTTLRDYVNADGIPGYFRQELFVYERAGKPCKRCGASIKHLNQGQRSTYWCPNCQGRTATCMISASGRVRA